MANVFMKYFVKVYSVDVFHPFIYPVTSNFLGIIPTEENISLFSLNDAPISHNRGYIISSPTTISIIYLIAASAVFFVLLLLLPTLSINYYLHPHSIPSIFVI